MWEHCSSLSSYKLSKFIPIGAKSFQISDIEFCCSVTGNSPEIIVGPMPVSMRKIRSSPVCSSSWLKGRFARPIHEHESGVHPPAISVRSHVVPSLKRTAVSVNDTGVESFGLRAGMAFVRIPSVPDVVNAFNSTSQQVVTLNLLRACLLSSTYRPENLPRLFVRSSRPLIKHFARSGVFQRSGDRER